MSKPKRKSKRKSTNTEALKRRPKKAGRPVIPPNYLIFGALGLILIIILIIRLNFLSIPFERDEGTYAYFGQLILDGKTAYTDFYELKPPLIYYSYAWIIALFGATLEGVHFGVTLLNLATVTFLFFIARRLLGDVPALATAAAYGLLSMSLNIAGFTAQSEHILVFYAMAGVAAGFKGMSQNNFYWILGGGILTACSALVKQNGLFFILFLGVAIIAHFLWKAETRDWKLLIRTLLVFSGGVLIPVIIFGLLLLLQGAMDDFVFWVLDYPRAYVSAISLERGMEFFGDAISKIFSNNALLWIIALFGLVSIHFTRPGRYRLVLIWAFLFFAFASIVPGLRFYSHYWIQLMPAIALLVGCAFYFLDYLFKERISSGKFKAAVPAALGLLVIVNLVQHQQYYFQPDHVQILRDVYTLNPFPESLVIGDYIKQRTTPDDKIFVLGSEPQIYFYSNCRGPSRHNYMAHIIKPDENSAQWRNEVLQDIQQDPPKFIVYFSHPPTWMGSTEETFNDLVGRAMPFINQNYKIVGKVDVFGDKNVQYVWGDAANAYQMRSNLHVQIYERR